ncbi:gliding motility-associated C-terminal domain-containing protein [Flavobacterium ginsengiterrae]|uniref:VWFA domain-containing protein n=1 Tax=Flavobacterium ginsengiterrae TaxID=871695 RepID=A0ABP7H169_9FLAO
MEKLLLFLNNFLRDIKKIQFVVLLLSSSIGFAQTITTNKTVTANASNCGIVNVKVDITGANPITRNSDVILAIDISGSMGNTISGDFKTSMDYAKDAALAFLNQAKANPQNRIAIVAYSTTASLKIGLTYLNATGVTQITNQINALQATNSTNIYAGIVRSETELETNGRFDCSTARAIILLTDGIANVTGTSGNTSCNVSKTSQCVTDAINAAANAKTTTKSSVVYNNQVFSVGLFGGISGNINTNNSDQNIAKYTLDNIQGSAAYITQSGANLTAIYNQIATQISWVAQSLVAKETIIPGFTISAITTSKGTASLSGQVITWNTDFLNSETITLNYQLTPTGSACGNQTVSTSTLNYQNSTCANDSKAITSPSYFVPCPPVITGALTACGSTTLTATTNAASPSYVWYKDNVVISGQTSATLTATASGVYKVKVKNGTTNCELTSADSTVSISPAAALVAPANASISGCSTAAITGLPYSAASTNITLAQLNSAGGSLSNSGSIGSYTISYSDTSTGTCPTVVTRTFKVTTSCGNVTAIQTIGIQDTTAPTWTTAANSLNVTLQCSDTAGLTAAQNQTPIASDNCGGTVTYTKISGSFSAGTCANSGTYTNTWTAKDVCNNTSTVFTQVITIQDTTVPTWTTAANALNVTLQCSDTAGLTAAQNQAPTATDNCGGTVTYTKTSGSFSAGTCANSGTYTNTWTAKDICNNTSAIFTQVITIQDTTVPTWTTAANALNVTLQCSDTAGLTAAQNQAPSASDNCGGTVTYTKTSGAFSVGSCANSGTYTNTWTAKDVCNNTSTVFTQVITIQDNTAPTWTTAANALNVTLQCSDTAGLTAAQNQAPIASDNCGGTVTYTKISGSFSAGTCANSGTYTNTWTAKDICNNTSTVFTQVITIQDTTAPTWTTAPNALNVTLQCSDTSGLTAAQNQAPIATDNCGGTVTYTKTSGSFSAGTCANSGTYTNTWTAKDICNNTSTVFTQVITIQDTTAPTWTTAANALNVTLQCSDTAGLTAAQNQAPVASDNCGGTVTYTKISGSFSAGSCANSGTYTNIWTAKDICNNTSTVFTQVITIQDTTAPTWTTVANALNVTLQCSDTSGLTAAQNQTPVATDNCGGTVTYTKTSGSFSAGTCPNSGTYTNTWTAKDICSNTSTVFTQVITIQDNTAPTWTTAPNSLNVTLQCSDISGLTAAQNQAPVASDNCGGTVTYTKISGSFSAGSCSNSGTYTNTWTAKDICNNTSTIFTQVITIQDNTAPTWTTAANSLNVTLQCSDTAGLTAAQNQAPVASDNCGGTVTYTKTSGVFSVGSCANSGTYTNTWIAKDICNNTSTIFTQVITIQDTSIPTWTTQSGSLNRTIECSDQQALVSVQALFPTASGACDIDLTNITKVSGQFMASAGCGNAGTYTNTWTVKDDCGNTSDTFTQVITIQDTTAPTWTTQNGSLNVTLECSDSSGLTSAQALFPTASDLCDADVSSITKVSGQFMASEGCSNAGTYTNTWTVKDDCGNTSDTFTQVITIQDTTAPTWTTQTGSLNVTLECSDSSGLASAQALFPTASDLCDADVSNLTKISGQFMASEGCNNAGTYTNTWTVKDDCDNTSDTFTQVITIQDTTAPTWTTQNGSLNVTLECSDTTGLASAQALFPTASDLCDADVSNLTKISGQFMASEGCGNAGTYTNTWTVKDDCGNTSDTFTQVITIQDTTAPTWTTQNGSLNVTLECSDTTGLASAQALFPTASDLCDADVSSITKISGQFMASAGCGNAGTYTNTWTVKDDCGNTSDTFTQVITIQDTTAPTWTTQNGSLNVTLECSDTTGLASAQALFPKATDLCDADVSNITKVSGQFMASAGCGNAGTYTNTWTVKDDCGNTSDTFTQVITIQDTSSPTFIGELPADITVSCDAVPQPANMEASDNCNGNLPIVYTETKSDIQNECASNYTLTRNWKTSDCSGNTVSHTQIITVRDTTAPTGTAPSDVADLQSITEIPAGNVQDIKDAADNCSSNVSITISDTNNEGSGCQGSPYILTRTYTLADCAGNKTELVQTFTVENKVTVSGIATNTTCLGGKDGSILVTSSPGSTVVITNDKNEVVGNTNLPAGTYTLTASSPVNENQNCTATATVTITEPSYTVKISGQVINVDTHSGIANVPITLIPQSPTTGPVLLHLTAADGSYSFSGMPTGNYLVQVQDANLNSAYQLYPIDSSLFFTTLEDCKIQKHDFEYGASTLPVLGDYVWYDTNSNGIQDEWYDANNDGIVTKNIPDSNGAIDYSLWEWIDLNGDGSYTGPLNAGELNAGGFGNAANANVIIDGPNGYHQEVIVGIAGFWRDRPNSQNPYGEYTIKLVREANFDAVASALGATGLVKVLPSVTDKKITSKTSKSQTHIVCSTTTESGYIVNVTPEDLIHLDIDFGVSCKTYLDIVANDDNAGPIAGVNNITHNVINVLTNDTLEGAPITSSQVIITTVTPNEFLQLNPDGSVDVLPNAPTGTLTLVYQICEADQTSNCDTATVTITIEAPVMTVTATSICVNDVPYIDYVVTPVNFTPVNGVTIAWANAQNTVITTMTNLPLSGRVLWPGALVDENGKGIDWPGWIFENNKWIQGSDGFESLRPTVNVTVSVNPSETITVNYPPADPYCTARPTFAIVANDDTPTPITGPAGVINIVNVLNNDTLNNSAINPNDVTLSTVTPDPKGVLTLNPDGSVDVAANAPGGTYTLVYQICEKADAGNCDTAIVTVTVLDSQVNANDDNYVNIGCNTFGLVGNVLSNDLKGQLPATLELVTFTLLNENNNAAKTDPNITIDASGNVTVSSLTPAGTYTYMYRICGKQNSENCDTATVTITVLPSGTTNITSKACNDDTTLLNLSDLLPEGTPLTGSWLDTSNSRALQGNILNAYGLALGSYTFEYKIVNENCPRSILLTMEINDDCKVLACQSILIHNAFSPNGDGKNDFFVIDGIDDLTCYPENTVEIYNRWGILVFETNNYNNTTNAFDGTSRGRTTIQQSDGLPTGTYFYIVTYKSLDGNNVIQNNKKEGYLYLSK